MEIIIRFMIILNFFKTKNNIKYKKIIIFSKRNFMEPYDFLLIAKYNSS